MNPRKLAAIGAAMIALAGCDGGGPAASGAHPSASSSASSSASNLAAWMDVAKCMRAHGHPNFPDPVEDGLGGWRVPESAGNAKAAACDELVRKAKDQTRALEAPSAADMVKLRQYAKCIREHGLQNFPDPDSDGGFNLPDGMRNSSAMHTAAQACKDFLPPQRQKAPRG
jgi:hypothetical protein